jgi:dTDP-4-amino-4,6-dideoxy-D-glucose acyltransferase
MGFLAADRLPSLGLAAFGENVLISDRCSLYGASRIRVGSNVRIDDFTVITAEEEIAIGSYVHIGAQVFIAGRQGVQIGDFVNISAGAAIFTVSDDFSGASLVGAMVPDALRNVLSGMVVLSRHSAVAARSVVLPGVTFGEGAILGALSLANESLAAWHIYGGVPARCLAERSKDVMQLEKRLLV